MSRLPTWRRQLALLLAQGDSSTGAGQEAWVAGRLCPELVGVAGAQGFDELEGRPFARVHTRQRVPPLPGLNLNHDEAAALLRSQVSLEVDLGAAPPKTTLNGDAASVRVAAAWLV